MMNGKFTSFGSPLVLRTILRGFFNFERLAIISAANRCRLRMSSSRVPIIFGIAPRSVIFLAISVLRVRLSSIIKVAIYKKFYTEKNKCN